VRQPEAHRTCSGRRCHIERYIVGQYSKHAPPRINPCIAQSTRFRYDHDEVIDRLWNSITTGKEPQLRAEPFQCIGTSNVLAACRARRSTSPNRLLLSGSKTRPRQLADYTQAEIVEREQGRGPLPIPRYRALSRNRQYATIKRMGWRTGFRRIRILGRGASNLRPLTPYYLRRKDIHSRSKRI